MIVIVDFHNLLALTLHVCVSGEGGQEELLLLLPWEGTGHCHHPSHPIRLLPFHFRRTRVIAGHDGESTQPDSGTTNVTTISGRKKMYVENKF